MRRKPFLLFALFLVISSPFVPACYSLDCARVGDTMSSVLNNCGEPTWTESRQEQRWQVIPPGVIIDGWYLSRVARPILVTVQIEHWTYNLGSNKFMPILTFENEILVSIGSGKYGFPQ